METHNISNHTSQDSIDSPQWIVIKLAMCFSIFVEALVSGVIIDILSRYRLATQPVLRVLGSFATGLVLAGGLVDVLPDALSLFARHSDNFQLPMLVIACTIALLVLLDKCVSVLIAARKRSNVVRTDMTVDSSADKLLPEGPGGRHTHFDSSLLYDRWYVSIIVLTGLSIHSLFVGIGMGAARSRELLLSIYLMIILHKGFVSASLAIVILHGTHVTRSRFYALMLSFSSMSAVGGVIGVVISKLDHRIWMVNVIFNCIAAGTFVYIALRELVTQFLEENERGLCADLCKLFMFVAGFIFLTIVIFSISLHRS